MSGELLGLYCLMALSMICSLGFGVMFIFHAKGERVLYAELSKDSLYAMLARSPRDATEAKMLEEYERESIRQHRVAFDENRKKKPEPKAAQEPAKAVDARGNVYDIIAGME